MKRAVAGLTVLFVVTLSQATSAADAVHGENLVMEHCTGCHDDSVYTRKERRVTTLGGLQKQVRRCELQLGLKWFDDDINGVVTYLNNQYYKFE
ncbi:MAG: cytochrome c [Gammaproteobacteria bacterium]|nr:MAG: cytochrome c [Gammaproteobacteria bacterium]